MVSRATLIRFIICGERMTDDDGMCDWLMVDPVLLTITTACRLLCMALCLL